MHNITDGLKKFTTRGPIDVGSDVKFSRKYFWITFSEHDRAWPRINEHKRKKVENICLGCGKVFKIVDCFIRIKSDTLFDKRILHLRGGAFSEAERKQNLRVEQSHFWSEWNMLFFLQPKQLTQINMWSNHQCRAICMQCNKYWQIIHVVRIFYLH